MKSWLLKIGAVLAMAVSLTGCGYNDFQRLDEATKSAWSEVVNQYQRRADLIDNLVNTVKGEAQFEQDTLNQVINARARATRCLCPPDNSRGNWRALLARCTSSRASLRRRLISSGGLPAICKGNATFCATVMCGNSA